MAAVPSLKKIPRLGFAGSVPSEPDSPVCSMSACSAWSALYTSTRRSSAALRSPLTMDRESPLPDITSENTVLVAWSRKASRSVWLFSSNFWYAVDSRVDTRLSEVIVTP